MRSSARDLGGTRELLARTGAEDFVDGSAEWVASAIDELGGVRAAVDDAPVARIEREQGPVPLNGAGDVDRLAVAARQSHVPARDAARLHQGSHSASCRSKQRNVSSAPATIASQMRHIRAGRVTGERAAELRPEPSDIRPVAAQEAECLGGRMADGSRDLTCEEATAEARALDDVERAEGAREGGEVGQRRALAAWRPGAEAAQIGDQQRGAAPRGDIERRAERAPLCVGGDLNLDRCVQRVERREKPRVRLHVTQMLRRRDSPFGARVQRARLGSQSNEERCATFGDRRPRARRPWPAYGGGLLLRMS